MPRPIPTAIEQRSLSYTLVDLTRLLASAVVRYPRLNALGYKVPLKTLITALLCISINRVHSVTKPLRDAFDVDEPISLAWKTIEDALEPQLYDALDYSTIDLELNALMAELDAAIGRLLPSDWAPAEFTFFDWIGDTVVLLKDG